MNSIEIEDLTKSYGDEKIFEEFNLEVKESQTVEIRGKSGVGKSTLFRCITGLEDYEGRITYNGELSIKFQNARMLPWLNLRQNILLPFKLQRKDIESKHHSKVSELSERFGLREHLNQNPKTLSGGQRQRAAVVRVLMHNPDIMLFDEPFASLDDSTLQVVKKEILKHCEKEDSTIIYSTQSANKFSFPDVKLNLD